MRKPLTLIISLVVCLLTGFLGSFVILDKVIELYQAQSPMFSDKKIFAQRQEPIGREVADEKIYIEAVNWYANTDEKAMSGDGAELIERWPDGSKKQVEPTLDGKRHGLAQYWWPNGQKYSEISWWEGLKNGRLRLYREDGSLEQNLSYRHGKPHGLACWYNETGKMTHRQVYIEGEAVSRKNAILPVCP